MTRSVPAPDDRDPYKILRVQKGATLRRIKEAYRKLADEHHPDHEGDEKTFKDVGWAYEILTKPGKLKAHEDEQVIAKAFVDARRREAARERREKERSDQQAQAVGDQFRGEETQLPLFRPPSGASSSPCSLATLFWKKEKDGVSLTSLRSREKIASRTGT